MQALRIAEAKAGYNRVEACAANAGIAVEGQLHRQLAVAHIERRHQALLGGGTPERFRRDPRGFRLEPPAPGVPVEPHAEG